MRNGSAPAAIALSLALIATSLSAQRGYYRDPALSGDVLVFVSEGDLWRIGIAGGAAARLTTHQGQEHDPAISPDGKTLAFIGHYEGGAEVYTMGIDGGRPVRRTFGAERPRLAGFTPAGKLLFASRHRSTLPNLQLFVLDPATGKSERLPLFEASRGALAPDRHTLFFTRFRHSQHVKRYVGGRAEQLWRFDTTKSDEAVPLTADWAGTSHHAMPTADRVYFISDRDGTRNLWSMSHDGKNPTQHTSHVGFDVLEASLSGRRIAYRVGAALRLLDTGSGEDREIPITLRSDFDQSRERWIEKPLDRMTSVRLSHDGKHLALTARGQAFVAPTKSAHGPVVTLSRKPDVRYRDAAFLGTGDRVTVLSDESDEVEVWSLPADGSATRTRVTAGATILLRQVRTSPDGKWIAWTDKADMLWLQAVESSEKQQLATDADRIGDLTWSADGRWLAYTRTDAAGLSHIRIHAPGSGRTLVATSPRFASRAPTFSPDGAWLWFLSNRDFRSTVRSPWGNYQPEPHFPKTTGIFAVALTEDVVWPFDAQAVPPRPDRDEDAEKTRPDGKDRKPKAEAKPKVVGPLPTERGALYRVPLPADSYSWLAATSKGLLYATRGANRQRTLFRLVIEAKPPKPTELAKDITPVQISGNGKKLLLRKRDQLYVVPADSKAPLGKSLDKARVDLAAWRLRYDPREDWRQIFVDSWRLHRDYFYDPGMHGVDWPAMRAKYQPLVARVHDRDELNDLIGQLIGELSALHSRASGGDRRSPGVDIANASLGADVEADASAKAWRIVRLYRADPERPELRAPLARPDLRLRNGDLILSIDGHPFQPGLPLAALLREKAGHVVRLELQRQSGDKLTCRLKAISSRAARDLRYHEWELACRERVDGQGAGKLGYIHLRAMGSGDIGDWVREYAPLIERQGLIIDVRHNGGGNIDSWILNRLSRKAWFYWQARHRRPYWNMQGAFRGHMVVLCDHATGSDGEAFAEGFRRLGLGKVIGTRTWGGEIWLSRGNRTVDGGVASAGEMGVYGPEGQWLIEGHGVVPDITVDNLPHAAYQGKDAQLDAAITHLGKLIAADPRRVPAPPAFPDKSAADNRPGASDASHRRQRR